MSTERGGGFDVDDGHTGGLSRRKISELDEKLPYPELRTGRFKFFSVTKAHKWTKDGWKAGHSRGKAEVNAELVCFVCYCYPCFFATLLVLLLLQCRRRKD